MAELIRHVDRPFRAVFDRSEWDCQEFRGGVAVEHQAAVARMNRSPKNTATTEK